MRLMIITALSIAMTGVAAAQRFQQAPREVQLSIGGDTHYLVEGRASTIELGGRKVAVKVVQRPSASLKFDGFSFNYPSHFTQLSSQDSKQPSSASWMLKGKTCQVTLHRKDKSTTLEFLVEHMHEFYSGLPGVKSLKEKPTFFSYKGRKLRGIRFTMNARREGLSHQDYYELPLKSKRYNYFLVLHSKPGEIEAEQVKRMIGDTLR